MDAANWRVHIPHAFGAGPANTFRAKAIFAAAASNPQLIRLRKQFNFEPL